MDDLAGEMDELIRRAANRAPAEQEADAAATAEQRDAAAFLGVPARHAHRLAGETREALLADGRELLAGLMANGYEPPGHVSFDGGVRQPVPQEPSMDSLMRAQREHQRRDVWTTAHHLDAQLAPHQPPREDD